MKKFWPFTFYLLYFAALSSLMPFLVLFYRELGFSGAPIGLLTGVPPLITLVASPLWTGVADAKNWHRWMMGFGLLVASLAMLVMQSLTEFIPVSSTAHLLIGQALLGISATYSRMFSFTVIIQLGTVLALILFLWNDIWTILQAFFLGIRNRNPFETHESLLGWLPLCALTGRRINITTIIKAWAPLR